MIRENATQRLLDSGSAAMPLLTLAEQSPDREIRDRSRRIMALIRERSRATQLAAFRAGRTTVDQSSLPGWSEFSTRYGDSPRSRSVYAQILQAEWNLLAAVYRRELSPGTPQELVLDRLPDVRPLHFRYSSPRYSMGTMLAAFVIAADFPSQVDINGLLRSFFLQRELRRALEPNSARPTVRRIVGTWLVESSSQHMDLLYCLQTATRYRLPEGVTIAQAILADETALVTAKGEAIQTLAVLGDRSHTTLLEPFLQDTTLLGTSRSGDRKRQMRDVALACLLYIHGEDVQKIGVRLNSANHPKIFQVDSFGFASEHDRKLAMQQWLALKAKLAKE